MNLTVEQLVEAALSLPSGERAILAERLLHSLDPAEFAPVQKRWAAEALRRRNEVRYEGLKTIPGAQALAQVRRAVK